MTLDSASREVKNSGIGLGIGREAHFATVRSVDMWRGGPSDPGGSDPPNLQQRFEQQQQLVAQLKDLITKPEQPSAIAKEKVEEYATALSELNARAKSSKLRKGDAGGSAERKKTPQGMPGSRRFANTDNAAKEKINLLRQQVEETKAKMAQREKNEKGIEEIVTQLNAHLDESENLRPLSLFVEPQIKYDANTPREELLNILALKDRHTVELTSKIQHLEANVLDLQENIKEKESVIDARTKAITLMSENLSKKSKTTLDMLEDTKEQMRHMQENFIEVEAEMKHQISVLKLELQNKNAKIEELEESHASHDPQTDVLLRDKDSRLAELTAANESLSVQCEVDKNRAESLEKTIVDLKSQLSLELQKPKSDEAPEEIAKLNKQLEEMNKSMIKARAQNKSKLKEMQKIIDDFKKIGDANAEVFRLKSEMAKLEQKIAVLEEEKGNLQLNLVDFDLVGWSDTKKKLEKEVEQLNMQVVEQQCELENHSQTISKLGKENEEQVQQLRALSRFKKDHVSSEITSIQLEEQLEGVDSFNQQLKEQIKSLEVENETLLEKINSLNREKQDLQEQNFDLMDRLDKLSAEKVSSAESIEIVEPLTQQEKMELEAYQKNLDFLDANVSRSGQSQDLNESVSKLTAESAELLEKIEMFNVERREVMDKLDNLTAENHEFSAQITALREEREDLLTKCEVVSTEKAELAVQLENVSKLYAQRLENVLGDIKELKNELNTSEQLYYIVGGRIDALEVQVRSENCSDLNKNLQDEINAYRKLIEDQRQQIKCLTAQATEMHAVKNDLTALAAAKYCLEETKSALEKNVSELVKERNQNSYENKVLNDHLNSVLAEMDDLEKQLEAAKEQEINTFREVQEMRLVIENNQNVIMASSETINSLQAIINTKEIEISRYETEISQWKKSFEEMVESFNRTQADCEAQTKNQRLMAAHVDELKAMLAEQTTQPNFKEDLAASLKTNSELKEKLTEMNREVEKLSYALDTKDRDMKGLIVEKNRLQEQLNNLKEQTRVKDEKFSQACNQLKEKCFSLESQINQNAGTLDSIRTPLEQKVKELENNCKLMETKNKEQHEKMKKIAINLKKKTQTCQELEAEVLRLKASLEQLAKKREIEATEEGARLLEYEVKLGTLIDQVKERDNTLEGLLAERDNFINVSCYKAIEEQKEALGQQLLELRASNDDLRNQIVEYESMLRDREQDDIRVNALLAKIEEQTMVIESLQEEVGKTSQKNYMLEDKLSKTVDLEEMAQREEALGAEIDGLRKANTTLESKLSEYQTSLGAASEQARLLQEKNEHFIKVVGEMTAKSADYESTADRCRTLEDENEQLQERLTTLAEGYNRMQGQLGQELAKSKSEVDSMDSELSVQLEQMNNERKVLRERCEKAEDSLKKFMADEEYLAEENAELKRSLAGLSAEYEHLKSELSRGNARSGHNHSGNLLAEIDRLNKVINEKTSEIENYRSQAMMKSFFGETQSSGDPFSTQVDHLKKQLEAKGEEICLLQRQVAAATAGNVERTKATEEVDQIIRLAENCVNFSEADARTFDGSLGGRSRSVRFAPVEDEIYEKKSMLSSSTPRPEDPVMREYIERIKELDQKLQAASPGDYHAFDQCIAIVEELLALMRNSRLVAGIDIVSIHEQVQQDSIDFIQTPTQPVHQLHTQPSPVPIEEECHVKAAYVCGPENKNDGWECEPEEVISEQKHYTTQYAENRPSEELQNQIGALESANSGLTAQLKESQLKCGKLIKKLKELKSKNEQLVAQMKTKTGGLDDLNGAILEELQLQVQKSEEKVNELQIEKGKLLQKLDVLVAANERMTEMKEQQDAQLHDFQLKNRDLNRQLEQLECWNDHANKPSTIIDAIAAPEITQSVENNESLSKRIQDLTEANNELMKDNEDLQELLEEQMKLRVAAEKSAFSKKSGDPQHFQEAEGPLNLLQQTVENLQKEIARLEAEKKALGKSFKDLELNLSDSAKRTALIEEELSAVSNEKSQLERSLEEKSMRIAGLESKIVELETESKEKVEQLQECSNVYSKEKTDLENALTIRLKEIEDLKVNIEKECKDKINLETQLEEMSRQLNALSQQDGSNEVELLNAQLNSRNEELAQLQEKLISVQSEYKSKLDATIEEWSTKSEEQAWNIATQWSNHLEMKQSEFNQNLKVLEEKVSTSDAEIAQLRQKLSNTTVNNEAIKQLENEMASLNDAIRQKERELAKYQCDVDELKIQLDEKDCELTSVKANLDAKEAEISHFKTLSKEKYAEAEKLQELLMRLQESESKLNMKQSELDAQNLKLEKEASEVKELSEQLSSLQLQLQEKEQAINSYNYSVESKDYEISQLRGHLMQKESDLQQVYSLLDEKERSLTNLKESLHQKESELSHMQSDATQKEAELVSSLKKDIQEASLKLHEKTQEVENLKLQMCSSDNRYEDLLSERDLDIESLRVQLTEQMRRYEESILLERERAEGSQKEADELRHLLDQLQAQTEEKVVDCKNLVDEIQRLNELIASNAAQTDELRRAGEALHAENEELKTQLEKEDALNAKLEAYQQLQTSRVEKEDNLADPVNRAELDVALYMLHQRDVRCEELTVELVQLLEERDTLQLRLSNTIRMYEELKAKAEAAIDQGAADGSPAVIEVTDSTEGSAVATIPPKSTDDPKDALAVKISQLRKVDYRKDVSVKDEQEARRMQQMNLMQQHLDIASMLPTEAAERLVSANYTLSRDVQSTPKVILNWFSGRTTPKQNDS